MSWGLLLCLLPSLAIATEAIEMRILQSSEFSDDMTTMSVWGSAILRDIEVLRIYNDTRELVFKQNWSRGNISDSEWKDYNNNFKRYFTFFQTVTTEIITCLGGKGPVIIQCQTGCITDQKDITSMYYKLALDGKEIIYVDILDGIWMPSHHPNSSYVHKMMSKSIETVRDINIFLENFCSKFAKNMSHTGKKALEKKVQPQVFISSQFMESGMEVTCKVTMFYPEQINVSLWKDMTHRMEDALSTNPLPNGDSTFQIQVFVKMKGEERTLYCRVEHSSLKEPLMVYWDGNGRSHVARTIGTAVGVVFFIIGILWIIARKQERRFTGTVNGENVGNTSM